MHNATDYSEEGFMLQLLESEVSEPPQDQDFFALHRANSDHAGIVHTTVDVNFKRLAANIVAEIEKRPDLTGRLLKVYRGSA